MRWVSGPVGRGVLVTVAVAVAVRLLAPTTGGVFAAGLVGGLAAGVGLGYYQSPIAAGWRVGFAGFVPYLVVVLAVNGGSIQTTVLAIAELLATVTFFVVGGMVGAYLAKRLTGPTARPTDSRSE